MSISVEDMSVVLYQANNGGKLPDSRPAPAYMEQAKFIVEHYWVNPRVHMARQGDVGSKGYGDVGKPK